MEFIRRKINKKKIHIENSIFIFVEFRDSRCNRKRAV